MSSHQAPHHADTELRRAVGFSGVYLNVVNLTIGSGIFLIPALIAGGLGDASLYAYLICGFAIVLILLCFVEMSRQVTTSGGAYAYIESAFGPYAGFLANAVFWFGVGVLVSAALMNGIADMLSIFLPVFKQSLPRALLFAAMLTVTLVINIRGVREGVLLVKVLTVIKVLPLLVLIALGSILIDWNTVNVAKISSSASLGDAALILFFAMTGAECVLNISGEMKHPKRTAPLGLLVGIITTITLFCFIHLTAQGALGADLVNHPEAPLAATATVLAGQIGGAVLIATALISIFGTFNALPLLFSRVMYAGAKDNILPAFLRRTHPRYATPSNALFAFSAIVFVIAISGGFRQLAVLVSAACLLLYAGVVGAMLRFRLDRRMPKTPGSRIPGGYFIAIGAMVVIFWFLAQLRVNEWIGIGIFLGLMSVLYVVQTGIQRRQRSAEHI